MRPNLRHVRALFNEFCFMHLSFRVILIRIIKTHLKIVCLDVFKFFALAAISLFFLIWYIRLKPSWIKYHLSVYMKQKRGTER